MGTSGRMLWGMFSGEITDQADRFLERDPDELDRWIEHTIDRLAELRSDGARILVVAADGAFVVDPDTLEFRIVDRVSTPGVRDGSDGLGEEHGSTPGVGVGSGATAGDRPE
jgi:hypothetical protein